MDKFWEFDEDFKIFFLIFGAAINNRVAKPIKYGTKFLKISAPSEKRIMAPNMLPNTQTTIGR